MHPCNTIPETLKPTKEREQALKYINQTSNVPGLHWKLAASQIYYSRHREPQLNAQSSNNIDKGTHNTSQLSE